MMAYGGSEGTAPLTLKPVHWLEQGGQISAPAALPSGDEPGVFVDRNVAMTQRICGHVEERMICRPLRELKNSLLDQISLLQVRLRCSSVGILE
jgi:hypothetical protein